ncbi:FolB [Geosmithia morbida]|uniref:FolB n=1 Tax=Geosmithia morbida TaxID=1094350 RepID=A0A9P4YVP7_9HYPO|nr:FolB [Geosmithia morbida]KAF4123966.1 FolB [Geosmithia morbida]
MKLSPTWEVRAAAGEPTATIHLQNLSTTITGPQDAWGRQARPQPCLTSVEVNMSRAFRDSSSGDSVASDTVHYGLLAKEVQRVLAAISDGSFTSSSSSSSSGGGSVSGPLPGGIRTLKKTVAQLVYRLVGVDLLLGRDVDVRTAATDENVFITAPDLSSIHVTVHLPKASLLGDGASVTGSAVLGPASLEGGEGSRPPLRAVTLKIHNIRVPTLIGVNDNERKAEQMVVANLEVGRWIGVPDAYTELESILSKTMRDSSYETLEALAERICADISQHLHEYYAVPDTKGWRLKISLEKPIAVPMADAPRIELSVDSCDLGGSK